LWNEIRNSNFPSLQNFSAYELRERITTPHPEWPKNFKSIRISIHGKIPLNIFEGVPDTLEKISLGLSADIGLVLDFLPSYTRSVVIPCVTVFSESNAFKLPQHLTSLNISGVVKVPISTLERFNLTWLDIASDRDNLSDDTAPLLPRTLTYLNMDKNQACTNSALKWLPRGLTELTANDNLNFSDEGIEDLPRSLIKLSLEWNQKILSHSIAKLPRTLTFLNMANNRRLDNTAVPLLPRRLTYLDLNENILIDDSVVHLFPPYLTHLDMDRSRKITFSVFTSKLPSLLRGHLQTLFIYCSQSQFTDYKELERLPACLKFISMAEIKDANQVRLSRQDWRVGHLWIRDYARNRYK
jgi:Leucine-rich repeat (LRR) protein